MKVTDLVNAVGDKNIRIQNIDRCATDFKLTKEGTKVTFVTDQPFDLTGTKDIGIVLWIPRDEVKKAMENLDQQT